MPFLRLSRLASLQQLEFVPALLDFLGVVIHHWPFISHCTFLFSAEVGKVFSTSGVTSFSSSGLGPG